MPKRSSNPKTLDTIQNARRVFLESVETTEISIVSRVMSEMGRKGGLIGGKRRLETMTDSQRSAVAKKAAKARWAKAKKNAAK